MLNDVERLMYAPSVEDVWAYLTSETKKLGLPYVHYTIYRVLEADGLDMPKEVMLLSNLDKSLLDRFENEDFLIAAPLSRWLHNTAARSLGPGFSINGSKGFCRSPRSARFRPSSKRPFRGLGHEPARHCATAGGRDRLRRPARNDAAGA
ncbi:autoinducer binding domain-containing protein [Paracoccus cavernae]|uniref:Autoinducer binding domain-containing protein n=1 Tax=Paracoccus cavernae TaxID=1571207 RepID=A0ABT8D8E7_9RHOB|nr:autoinducer binding domain-containing protein [Paracoccus cavernae]